MSAATNDGGPAFPILVHDGDRQWRQHYGGERIEGAAAGLSKREYFAAKALSGMLASGQGNPEKLAADAYAYADAMLTAPTTNARADAARTTINASIKEQQLTAER